MPVENMDIHSNIRDYRVNFENDCGFLTPFLEERNCAFIVDENVWASHAAGCLKPLQEANVIVQAIGEDQKRLESVLALYDRMMEREAKRNMTVVSIGGGITQDITGFMASTLYRGVNWVFVPTTLLAQADSCIGSKTSLNYRQFKNLVGTFYPPSEIFIFAPFLETQAESDFLSGLGEVVKLHLMGGELKAEGLVAALPAVLSREPSVLLAAVQDSLRIKQSYMEGDEFDTGRRNLLNFGHCFGHALESATDFAVPHGLAVVIGMLLAGMVAVRRGLLAPALSDRIASELLMPVACEPLKTLRYDSARVIDAMKQDKKRTGPHLSLVMLADGYKMLKVTDLTEREALDALAELDAIPAGARGEAS